MSFSPTTTGARSAAVSVSDDAAGSPQQVPLSGTGVAPAVTLSPTSLSFAAQPLTTTSPAQTVTLTNSGTASLTISSIAASASFGQTSNCPISPSALAPNASCTINVTFSPTVSGPNAGSVTVTDDATGSPHKVSLSGTGTDFSISASPASQTVKAGKSATYTLMLSPISGFTGAVGLTCSGAPPKGSCTVTPTSLSLNGTNSSTSKATIKTMGGKGGTPKGTYTLTFAGTFSRLQHSTAATLIVQ